MAIYLFKLIRRKLREREAQNAIPTTDESHLVPENKLGQKHTNVQESHDQHAHATIATPVPEHETFVTAEEAARHQEEARRRTVRQWKLMLGLALPNFLAAVDVTIVAPAIPLISSHFSMPFMLCAQRLKYANSHRPSVGQLQLDRRCIYTHFHDFRASFRSACRHIWTTFCAAVRNVLDHGWQCSLCGYP